MNDKLLLNMNEYLPLRDVVFNTLRTAIITGEFAPGERLMEISLAERMGVSRTPVREAIRKLELEGLVVMIPRRGAEVARITEAGLKEVLEVRCALEELAVELACRRRNKGNLEQLKEAHQKFVDAVKKGDTLEITNQDEAFHECIFDMSSNKRLVQVVHNLKEQMFRYRMEYVKDVSYHEELIREHEKLLALISKGDEEGAREVMKHHIHNQEKMILSQLHK
ncbi:MAG: GntR family transcriptional regulator [Lachnospiraceae bacterium]|nr:GntR family transcriptional regulator [Lachnospiraceae bacterium]